jgi:TolB-like protein
LLLYHLISFVKFRQVQREQDKIIVERIDNYTDVEILIEVLTYNHEYVEHQDLIGKAFFGAKNGKHQINARASYKTGEKRKDNKGHEYEVRDYFSSTTLNFVVKNNKHVFYVEYIPNPKSTKITKADSNTSSSNEFFDIALSNAYDSLSTNIPEKSKIAIINISAQNKTDGEYIISELTVLFVNSRKFSMVDRKSLDAIRAEQQFQMTGEVDDDSVVSIGKLLGAEVVITGNIEGQGDRRRLRLKALDVKTAEILGMSSDRL